MTRVRAAVCGLGLLVLTAGCATLGGSEYASAPYPNYVDESIFYAQLDPYGSWIEVQPYGLCWVPDDVAWGWRPYSYGSWAYTDYGWTWISDEPWGWATYHYGRWVDDPAYGWTWVPGNEWAPAWVAWRSGDDWIGWAALPPDAGWNPDGLSGYEDNSIPAEQWCFVRGRKLLNVDLRTSLAPSVRNETLLQRTRDVTRFGDLEGKPVNHGVALVTVERLAGRRPPELKIEDVTHPETGRAQDVQGETVRMFRTTLRPMPAGTGAEAREAREQIRTEPRPPRSAPPPVTTTHQLEKQREEQNRQAQATVQREQIELNREQSEELKQARSAAAQQEVLQRQAAERKAFEERRARESERMQAQLQRRFAKAGGDTTQVRHLPPKMVNVKH